MQGGDVGRRGRRRRGRASAPAWSGRRVLVDPALYRDDGPGAPPVGYLGSELDGGFAGLLVVAATHVHDVDDSPLSLEELACLPVAYGTATRMLRRAELARGETVLVTGASGGVGVALVQLAVARAPPSSASAPAAKADAVLAAGATGWSCATATTSPLRCARPRPTGVQVVADVVGGPGVGELLPLLDDDGRWVIAGAIAGPLVQLDLRRLYLRSLRMIGSSMHTRADFAALVEPARAGTVRPPIAARFPLREIHAAQEEFATSRHVGKIVLLP